VVLTGVARGVKEFGGILDQGVREVMISTTASSVPVQLELDVSHLMINDTIHVSDLVALYPDIEFLDEGHINLAHVSPPKKLEIAELEEGAEEEAAGAGAEGEGAEGEGAAGGGEEA
jgi:hypothetical protein